MTPHDVENDMRVYAGLGRAIRSVAPVAAIADVGGEAARIAAGLTVYRNNVRAAFLRVLREAFPVVERIVGVDFFRYLAHEYFHACPASSPIAARYGEALPDFVETFAPASGLPYLADVARLELAWLGAYHAAEAQSLTPEEIFNAIRAEPDCARFTVHPSMRLLSSPFPVHTIWLHNKNQCAEALKLHDAGERALFVRPAHKVVTSTISPGVYNALTAISDGYVLADALTRALESEPDAALPEIIAGVATSGVVTAVSTGIHS